MMITADRDLDETLDNVFGDSPTDPWAIAAEMGLPWVGIDESRGGVGGTVPDQVAIASAAARYSVSAPVVETQLGAFVLASLGAEFGNEPLTLALAGAGDTVTRSGGRVRVDLRRVPWARQAGIVVVAPVEGETIIGLLEVGTAGIEEGEDLAGQPLDRVIHDDMPVVGVLPQGNIPSVRHALLRSAQLAGVLQRYSQLTRRYTATREQFGRPLDRFQAVQEHLVVIEQAAVAATLVVRHAAHVVATRGDHAARAEVGAAYLVVDHHAGEAAAAAHQAHGAMGMTREYPLAQLSRQLHSWRGLAARHRVSAEHLGRHAAADASIALPVSSRDLW